MKPGSEEFWKRVSVTVERLDSMSYYDLLGLEAAPPPSPEQIRDAYYGMVRHFHPDRYARERDPARKRQLSRLYARMGEAYRVLSRTDLREKYDAGLGEGKTRLSADSEGPRARRPSGADPITEKARQLYQKGLELVRSGNPGGARAQLELAAQFEPDSKAIREALGSLPEEAAEKPERPSLEEAPDRSLSARAREAMSGRRYAEARALWEKAVRMDPDDAGLKANFHLACAYAAQAEGKGKEAKRHFQAALRYDANCKEAILALRGTG